MLARAQPIARGGGAAGGMRARAHALSSAPTSSSCHGHGRAMAPMRHAMRPFVIGPNRGRGRSVAARAMMEPTPGTPTRERVIAALPYLLPLLDGIPYGKFLLLQYPFVARALSPLAPLAALYNIFPLMPFIVFLGVYSGIVNNPNNSRFVRYNAAQAVLLDILLIVPQILLENVIRPPSDELGQQLYISAENTIFLFVCVSVAVGMGSSMVGLTARLPLVAEAADSQTQRGPGGGGW